MTYNADEGVLKIFLRGRPVNLYAPSSVRDEYELNKAIPAPQSKLKLEWVYPLRQGEETERDVRTGVVTPLTLLLPS